MLTKYLSNQLMKIVNSFIHKHRIWRIDKFALFFVYGLSLTLVISACSSNNTSNSVATQAANQSATNQDVVIRIGYQKAATILNTMRVQKDLEKAFTANGASVTWAEFPSGPPMLEAMNAGSIDFGYTGESPPIFAQAAGNPLVYVAYDPWGSKAEAILVPKSSSIKTLADLKGKRIGVAKGSNTNYLLVKVLEKGRVDYKDIKPAFLQPPDARAAFEGNNIDAWAIWDPYLSAAQAATGARTLTDATGLAPNRGYYLAAKSFVDKYPDALKTVLDEVKKRNNWAKNNPTEVAKFLSPQLGIDVGVLEVAEKRRDYGVLPLTEEVIRKQQEIADTFYKIKLIPKSINVSEIVWKGNQ